MRMRRSEERSGVKGVNIWEEGREEAKNKKDLREGRQGEGESLK